MLRAKALALPVMPPVFADWMPATSPLGKTGTYGIFCLASTLKGQSGDTKKWGFCRVLDTSLTVLRQDECQNTNGVNVLDKSGRLATSLLNSDSMRSSMDSIVADF